LIEKFASTTSEHRLKWRPWLTNPVDVDAERSFALRHTDIDVFEHVTNTAYWHAVHEVMAEAPDVCRAPYRAVIEYRRPIQYGENVSLRWARRDSDVHIAIAVGDEIRAAGLLRKL
jgi:acyl-ACP thioesterase